MLSSFRRTPCFLRIPPVYSKQQIRQLRSRDCNSATFRRRPDQLATLEPFCEQATPLAVMPDQFYKIAPPPSEAKQMTAERIMLQDLLHPKCQRRKPTRHVRISCGNPNPNILLRWKCDHGCRRKTSRTRSSVSVTKSLPTRTRCCEPTWISIIPVVKDQAGNRSQPGAVSLWSSAEACAPKSTAQTCSGRNSGGVGTSVKGRHYPFKALRRSYVCDGSRS